MPPLFSQTLLPRSPPLSSHLGLVELLISTCIDLYAIPEPLLFDHMDPEGHARKLGWVHVI